MMQLSKNFWLSEFTKSDTAIRQGIDNSPEPEHLVALAHLCCAVLQPVRDALGPIKVTSGYRSLALNRAIGGSQGSQHSKGEAADIECFGPTSNLDLAKWIVQNVNYDQMILEHWDGVDPKSGWIHVSARVTGNRKQQLRAFKRNGKTVYEPVDVMRL
jgi:zinc D-Ala-D-Ala carboxypeptidase